jgi:hypothetical protein
MFIASTNLWQNVVPGDWPAYRFLEQPRTRDEYRSLVQDRGMFLCTSLSESFGIYYLELMLSGAVGVFLDKPWVRSLLPNYKLVYSEAELAAAYLSVYRNWDQYYEYVQKEVVPWVRQTYDLDKFVQGLLNCNQLQEAHA